MAYKTLHATWTKPNNAKLTSKQLSFRLPVHIAAKLQALCDLYPERNRTEIIADLLDHAMTELEASLPLSGLTEEVLKDGQGKSIHHCKGFRVDFRDRANLVYEIYQQEQGVQNPEPLYPPLLMTQADFKATQAALEGAGPGTKR